MSNLGEAVDNTNLSAVNEEDNVNVICMEETVTTEYHISEMTQENVNIGLISFTIEEKKLDISNVVRIEETVAIQATDEEEQEFIGFFEEMKEGTGELVKLEKHDIQVSDILMKREDIDVVHSEEELDTEDETQTTEIERKRDFFGSYGTEGNQLEEAFGIEILKDENIINEDKARDMLGSFGNEGNQLEEAFGIEILKDENIINEDKARDILKDENNTNAERSIEVELQISDITKEDANVHNEGQIERKVQTLEMLTEDNIQNKEKKIGEEIVQPHKLVKEVYKCGLSQDDHEDEKMVDVDCWTEIEMKNKILRYLPNLKISSVKRVENNFLKGLYYLKKEEYESRNVCTREEVLFHSTAVEYVNPIIKDNYDWTRVRRCKFGKGISFSTDADYANCHANRCNGLYRAFIITKVLIGRSTTGSECLKIPRDGYDTTTGVNGMVKVKYNNNEFLPEYVVYYESGSISDSKYYSSRR